MKFNKLTVYKKSLIKTFTTFTSLYTEIVNIFSKNSSGMCVASESAIKWWKRQEFKVCARRGGFLAAEALIRGAHLLDRTKGTKMSAVSAI